MSHAQQIFDTLVVNRTDRTAKQLAAQLKTTVATVHARIADIRDMGWFIDRYTKVDTKGRRKIFYTKAQPTREYLQVARQCIKVCRHHGLVE